jgi:glycosyltransferase involved in cell wall biosynthesis
MSQSAPAAAPVPAASRSAAARRRPRLAVLIPVFNDQAGLERSLRSLADDAAEFDVVVVDDGSQPPIRIPPRQPYSTTLLRQMRNSGITAALNAGLRSIAEAGYQYVARLDAGDLSLSQRLTAQLNFLDQHPEHAAVGTATLYVNPSGDPLFEFHPPTEHRRLMRFFRYRQGLVHPSAMMRVEAVLANGLYSESYPGGEDYDLFMRLGETHRIANLGTMFVVKEVAARSITANHRATRLCRLKILAAHFDPWSIHSYLGMIFNVWLLIAPRALVHKVRALGKGH